MAPCKDTVPTSRKVPRNRKPSKGTSIVDSSAPAIIVADDNDKKLRENSFRFLDLPAELRVMIYKEYMNNICWETKQYIPASRLGMQNLRASRGLGDEELFRRPKKCKKCRSWPIGLTPLLCVDRQVRCEVMPLVFEKMEVCVHNDIRYFSQWTKWTAIGTGMRLEHYVRNIYIDNVQDRIYLWHRRTYHRALERQWVDFLKRCTSLKKVRFQVFISDKEHSDEELGTLATRLADFNPGQGPEFNIHCFGCGLRSVEGLNGEKCPVVAAYALSLRKEIQQARKQDRIEELGDV